MSASTEAGDIQQARAQLDLLCRKVGLALADALPGAQKGIVAPDGTALWTSAYALLTLWPVPSIEPSIIAQEATTAQAWLDEILSGAEAPSGRAVDGYLVLALPEPPQADANEEIRRIELSSQVCRKHVVWPSADEAGLAWQRMADVTVLGLPDAETAAAGELFWPKLDQKAQALWDDVTDQGPGPAALRDGTA